MKILLKNLMPANCYSSWLSFILIFQMFHMCRTNIFLLTF